MAWLVAGHISLALGIVGAFLPIMPTTVFLIGAAACYARGSEHFYHWLLHHKWFGPPIRDWELHRAMTVKAKVLAIVSMAGGIAASAILFVSTLWVRILLGAIAVGVTLLILSIRTKP
jgi:uncharacterized membrane protein YbaN (DUF454 family)